MCLKRNDLDRSDNVASYSRRNKAKPSIRASHKLWLMDLDDTLFESSAGMLHAIHLRMNDFIMKRLHLSLEEASELRREYWGRYGSTFLGLWKNHQVDPKEFLPATHDFDFSPYVKTHGNVRLNLTALSGKKVLFTNGPRNYADAVLSCLHLNGVFDDEITSTEMYALGQWRPKPSATMLRIILARHGVKPSEAVLVDDSLMNLKCAKSIGMKTVWCVGYRRANAKLSSIYRPNYCDHVIGHIRELVKL